jgi:hypothetical protein
VLITAPGPADESGRSAAVADDHEARPGGVAAVVPGGQLSGGGGGLVVHQAPPRRVRPRRQLDPAAVEARPASTKGGG